MPTIYNYATYTFMLTTILCSVVRYFHVCRPFVQYADYFYPSRIETSILFFYAAILQIPYFIYGDTSWGINYGTVIFLLSFASFYTILIVRYFIKKPSTEERIFLIIVAMIPSLPYFIDGLLGGKYIFSNNELVTFSSLVIGIVVFSGFCYSILRLIDKIKHYNLSNYSSEEDFPFKFAFIVFGFTGISALCFWGNWLAESNTFMAIMHVVLSILAVAYLLVILHPQHPSSYQCVFPKDPNLQYAAKDNTKGTDDTQRLAKVIYHKIYNDRLYLDAHLSLIQLASEIGYGRTITSKVCNEFYGGFYKLVNEARIKHAQQLQAEHPEYTQDAIAKESGFTNRNSLLRVKRRLLENKID